jgi:uncharacterized protein YfaQ (DUF2300 family)
MSEKGPRSAVEIVMERLRQKDVADGVEHRPRTEQQKAAIAEIRSIYEAKLAQADVMLRTALGETFDLAVRTTIEQNHQREREQLTAERDAKIERIRAQNPTT